MWYAIYRNWNRWAGYWVPAYCEHPDCNKEIDRWMSYACWWEPFSEYWCDRYFCEEHMDFLAINQDGEVVKDEDYEIEKEDSYEFIEWCERCKEWKDPFPYKQEHPNWLKHILTDESWEEWRNNSPKEVLKYKEELNDLLTKTTNNYIW